MTVPGQILVSCGAVGGRGVSALSWCCGGVVCPSKTSLCVRSKRPSPCMPAPRAHVETCGRVIAGIHGDVLNVHTETFWTDIRGFFSVSHHTTPHTQQDTRHNTQDNNHNNMHHNNTLRQRQRETEKEDRERERREDEIRKTK